MEGKGKAVIVIDDSLNSDEKIELNVDNISFPLYYLQSVESLCEREIPEEPLLISVVANPLTENALSRILAETKGYPHVLFSRKSPSIEQIGRLAVDGLLEDGSREKTRRVEDRLMEESLEYFRLSSSYQHCLHILSSYDLEQILKATLDALSSETEVESCVIWLADIKVPDQFTIAAVRGLINIDYESSLFLLSMTDFYEHVLAGESFVYPYQGDAPEYLYAPLKDDDRTIGLIKVGKKLSGSSYSEGDRKSVELIARYSSLSLNNINRISRLETVTLIDPETKVYSANFFKDYFEKEAAKSLRFDRNLSIIYMEFENFSHLMTRVKEVTLRDRVTEILKIISATLRDSDVISRRDSNNFCILLPETDYIGALITIKRIQDALTQLKKIEYLGVSFEISIIMRAVTYPHDGDSLDSLSISVTERFNSLRKSPVYRYRLWEKKFWDIFSLLVTHEASPKNIDEAGKFQSRKIRADQGRNRYFSFPSQELIRIIEVIAQDISVEREGRGILVIAGPRPELSKQILSMFSLDEVKSKKVYIIGKHSAPALEGENIMVITDDDKRLERGHTILYLKSNGSFALIGQEMNENVFGLTTCDGPLVETLYEKIRKQYMIQGTL